MGQIFSLFVKTSMKAGSNVAILELYCSPLFRFSVANYGYLRSTESKTMSK